MENLPVFYQNIIENVLAQFNDIEGSLFEKKLYQHAKILYEVNIKVIKSLFNINEEFEDKVFKLFIASYLIDSCLDLTKENIWNKPTFLFAGMQLYSEYKLWVETSFDRSFSDVLEKLYHYQWEYQVLERKWEMPLNYVVEYNGYDKYYKKQIVLLHPFLLLKIFGYNDEKIKNISNCFQIYYSIILEIDDLFDVAFDIDNQILTPIVSNYYLKYRELPTHKDNKIEQLLKEVKLDVKKRIELLQEYCRNNSINFSVFKNVLLQYVEF